MARSIEIPEVLITTTSLRMVVINTLSIYSLYTFNTHKLTYTYYSHAFCLPFSFIFHLFQIKLVNIHSCDIANDRAKPTLGLVLMLILHFQVS